MLDIRIAPQATNTGDRELPRRYWYQPAAMRAAAYPMPSAIPRSGLTMPLSVMVRRIRATTMRKQRVARRGNSEARLAQWITSSERLSGSPAAALSGLLGRGGSDGGLIVSG